LDDLVDESQLSELIGQTVTDTEVTSTGIVLHFETFKMVIKNNNKKK
jgi:hypothetical protein